MLSTGAAGLCPVMVPEKPPEIALLYWVFGFLAPESCPSRQYRYAEDVLGLMLFGWHGPLGSPRFAVIN